MNKIEKYIEFVKIQYWLLTPTYKKWTFWVRDKKVTVPAIISQFCRIGKDCYWKGDRLFQNDENCHVCISWLKGIFSSFKKRWDSVYKCDVSDLGLKQTTKYFGCFCYNHNFWLFLLQFIGKKYNKFTSKSVKSCSELMYSFMLN